MHIGKDRDADLVIRWQQASSKLELQLFEFANLGNSFVNPHVSLYIYLLLQVIAIFFFFLFNTST
jgi:hypothetical protein